jgi:hypothetical protein
MSGWASRQPERRAVRHRAARRAVAGSMHRTLLPLLALLLGLTACGPLQPASGPPTYNRDIGGQSGA